MKKLLLSDRNKIMSLLTDRNKIMSLLFIMLTVTLAASAKVVKLTMTDGTAKVYTSSQLGAINVDDDGNVTVTDYQGAEIEVIAAADIANLSISDDIEIVDIKERALEFSLSIIGYDGPPIFTRPGRQVNFVYPSADPFGNPVTLSGVILIPEDIITGWNACDGILLFNHYTVMHRDEAPSRGYDTLESMFLANPLMPNYIAVESAYYGLGVTERFPQAYIQGTINARANLDCLLAARHVLSEMGIDYGPLTFNVGYSSGGFEALASQKLRDMEYADQISFDKTFAGGSPSDVKECYRQYVLIDSTAYNAVLPFIMIATNEVQQLNLNYEDVFQPWLASRIDELFLSKDYSAWPICDSIGREKKVHELLTEPYCNLSSTESRKVQSALQTISITNDWEPDPTQRIFLFHSRDDDYVPVQSARPVISYLQYRGFTPSIIPGRTNLQTNFILKKMGHLSATAVYLVQSVAAIAAWPEMYENGQLKPVYNDILTQDIQDPITILRYLDEQGIDCRPIINQLMSQMMNIINGSEGSGDGTVNIFALMSAINDICNSLGTDPQELTEMFSDSGIDIMSFFLTLITYLHEQPDADGDAASARVMRAMKNLPQTPAYSNELLLRNWLTESGVEF